MFQFYFISIVLNLVCAFYFINEKKFQGQYDAKAESERLFNATMTEQTKETTEKTENRPSENVVKESDSEENRSQGENKRKREEEKSFSAAQKNAWGNNFSSLFFLLLASKNAKIVLFVALAAVSLVKLIFPVRGIFLFGDLLIAFSSFIAAASFFLQAYQNLHSSLQPFILKRIYYDRRNIGFLCLAAAALHFLFPASILL